MSGVPSDDEEGGDGDEGDEGEEEGGEDEAGATPDVESMNGEPQGQETEDSEMPEAVQPTSVEEPEDPHRVPSEEEASISKGRFQPPNLASLGPPHTTMHLASPKTEGSPLKNVMIPSPTEPTPMISPQGAATSFSTTGYLDVHSHTMATELSSGATIDQALMSQTTAQGIFDPSGAEQVAGEDAAMESTDLPPATTPPTAPTQETTEAPAAAATAPAERAEPAAPATTESSEPPASDQAQQASPVPATESPGEAASLQPPDSPALLPTVTEDEDDGLNLLGSLERELDRQEGMSNPGSGASSGPGSEGKGTPLTVPVMGAEGAADTEDAPAPSGDEAEAQAAATTAVDSGGLAGEHEAPGSSS